MSVHASAQDTTYFAQDFDDWEDRNFRTWSQHNDSTITTATEALPHVKFNHIQGGLPERATLDITYASGVSGVIANRSLKVFIPNMEGEPESPHYGRSISYYLGGKVVRGDAAVDTTWKKGQPIRDSFVPDNDEMYLRYHIKLDSSWMFEPAGDKAHVVKIPGLAGTHKSGSGDMWPQDPDSLGWSARMLAGRGPEYGPDEWSPISYVYHLDQKCGNLVHSCGTGDHFPSGSDGVEWDLLPRHQMGQWYRIEQRIKMNDPNNGPGQGNGLIEVWIDGEKDPDLCNYELRYTTADTIGINRLWADIHYGGKYLSPADNTLYLDNFHVSTGPTPWSGELVGDSGWSGTIHVDGDVIVPDGMTLTINAGTVIEFQPGHDRHQFSAGETGVNNRSEIFVYGTLLANGTATDSVRFQRSGTAADNDAWGGIRIMDGGSVTLHHTEIRDTLPGRPTDLQAERGDGQATLRWTKPNHVGITKWKHRPGTISGTDTTWAPWQAIADSDEDTDSHLLEALTNGTTYTFQVRAVNPTGDGPPSESSAAVIPAGPPEPPEVMVTPGHEEVILSWTPGDDNGSAIQRHELRYSADAGTTWDPDWSPQSVREDTIGNLLNDTEYTFQMRGRNEVDYSEVVEVKATPRHPIRGRAAISFPENSTATVATYRFRAPASWPELALAYGLEVVDYEDSTHFQLDDGRLRFRAAPDFEAAGDVNGDNVYGVRLRAAPASGPLNPRRPPPPTFSRRVEVTVTNVEEPGTVALSPATAPRVGTAVTATLRDPDSGLVVRREDWQWQSRAPGSTTWTTISGMTAGRSVPPSPESAEQSSYTPRPADAGQVLRAVVNHYADGHGPGKRAVSGETDPVRANGPTKPRDFTADPGDGRVTLSWNAPESNRGATITGYAYRYTRDENTRDETSWTAGTLGVTASHRAGWLWPGLTDGRREVGDSAPRHPMGCNPRPSSIGWILTAK